MVINYKSLYNTSESDVEACRVVDSLFTHSSLINLYDRRYTRHEELGCRMLQIMWSLDVIGAMCRVRIQPSPMANTRVFVISLVH